MLRYNGKKHWYYPDFYLLDYDICVEIKPTAMMDDRFDTKAQYARQKYENYVIISEHEIESEQKLYEHLRLRL